MPPRPRPRSPTTPRADRTQASHRRRRRRPPLKAGTSTPIPDQGDFLLLLFLLLTARPSFVRPFSSSSSSFPRWRRGEGLLLLWPALAPPPLHLPCRTPDAEGRGEMAGQRVPAETRVSRQGPHEREGPRLASFGTFLAFTSCLFSLCSFPLRVPPPPPRVSTETEGGA